MPHFQRGLNLTIFHNKLFLNTRPNVFKIWSPQKGFSFFHFLSYELNSFPPFFFHFKKAPLKYANPNRKFKLSDINSNPINLYFYSNSEQFNLGIWKHFPFVVKYICETFFGCCVPTVFSLIYFRLRFYMIAKFHLVLLCFEGRKFFFAGKLLVLEGKSMKFAGFENKFVFKNERCHQNEMWKCTWWRADQSNFNVDHHL